MALLLAPLLLGAAPASPLAPTLLPDETYGETFTAVADLEGGAYVQVSLTISNLGPGDAHALCRFLVIEPRMKPWLAADRFDRAQWHADDGPAPRLIIGPCSATAGKTLDITAALDGGQIHLVLDAPPSPVEPPEHRLPIGESFYESEILVPWARATLVVSRPGQPPRRLSGAGYADHSRSTALPSKIGRLWIRFRALGTPGALVLVRYPPQGEPRGYAWSRGAAQPEALRHVKIGRRDPKAARAGGDAARRGDDETNPAPEWRVLLETQPHATWKIGSKDLIYRDAPVESHGLIGPLLKSLIGNPVTYTYHAELEITGSKQPIPGILEAEIEE